MPEPSAARSGQPGAVLLTGASSGIGRELALLYAAQGCVLHLAGRDEARLEETAAACRRLGAEVTARVVDVRDAAAMADWVQGADRAGGLDLVIANAGTYLAAEEEADAPAEAVRAVFDVNVQGVLNTVLPAIPGLRARRRGQIALMSSLAGFRGMAMMPSYCGSKAAVRVWGESLRRRLAADNVGVTVVCLGHVRTPICRAEGPDVLEAPAAAQIIARGVALNRPRIAYPLSAYGRSLLVSALPPAAFEFLRGLRGRTRPRTGPGADETGAAPEGTAAAIPRTDGLAADGDMGEGERNAPQRIRVDHRL